MVTCKSRLRYKEGNYVIPLRKVILSCNIVFLKFKKIKLNVKTDSIITQKKFTVQKSKIAKPPKNSQCKSPKTRRTMGRRKGKSPAKKGSTPSPVKKGRMKSPAKKGSMTSPSKKGRTTPPAKQATSREKREWDKSRTPIQEGAYGKLMVLFVLYCFVVIEGDKSRVGYVFADG